MPLLQQPGQGIMKDKPPVTTHNEYPKHMAHPAFDPGCGDEEVKLPGGKLVYRGGKPIRFPPVLVMDAQQEEYHISQGYESIGKSDPQAFARAVASLAPPVMDHKPIEYPKWIPSANAIANNPEEEAALLGLDAPALDTEGAEPGSHDAVLAAVDKVIAPSNFADREIVDVLKKQNDAMAAQNAALQKQITEQADSMAQMKAMMERLLATGTNGPMAEAEDPPAKNTVANKAPEMSKGEKIKAGIAKKKAAQAEKQAKEITDPFGTKDAA
jgi:hypothetical protein